MSDANEILGLMDDDDTAAPVGLPEGLDLSGLSLGEDDLVQATEYKHIPPKTTTNFEIYTVTAKVANGKLKWDVTLRAVDDTWGKNKQVRLFFTIIQAAAWSWGPFLKAAGLIKNAGKIDPKIFNDPTVIEGVRVQATVIGYRWSKDGNYFQSYGQKASAIPTDGTAYFEELRNFKPAPVSTDAEDEAADGIEDAEFSDEDYL